MEIEMEHGQGSHPVVGAATLTLSWCSAIFAAFTIKDAQPIVGFVASLVAIISGLFAIRYYYYSTKKLKR